MPRWMISIAALGLALLLFGSFWILRSEDRADGATAVTKEPTDQPANPVVAPPAPMSRVPTVAPRATAAADAGAEIDPREDAAAIGQVFSARYDSVREQVEAYGKLLVDSGVSTEAWTAEARSTLNASITEITTAAGGPAVRASAPECYRLGCIVRLTSADEGSREDFSNRFQSSEKARAWPGSRLITAGYADQGSVKSSLIFIRPQ